LFLSQFLLIGLTLVKLSLCQPVYVILAAGVGRTVDTQEETLYQNQLDPQSMEALEFIDDPAKLYAPNDFLSDLHKLAVGVQKFVQDPPSSLYNALTKKHHKKQGQSQSQSQGQSQKPVKHKVVLDPFGNISLFLGWSVNFQVANSIGLSSRSLGERPQWLA
ncbi:hypothetical protein KR054_007906, partial [Drosophila jambulina]